MPIVKILDDYQQVALASADWSAVRDRYTVDVLGEHISDEAELVNRLAESEVIVALRERTAFPARVLRKLQAPRLLVTTGMRNRSIDLDAAKQQGIVVCGTSGSGGAVWFRLDLHGSRRVDRCADSFCHRTRSYLLPGLAAYDDCRRTTGRCGFALRYMMKLLVLERVFG